MSQALELHSIKKSYGDFVAVDELSFAVPAGSTFGLLGPNGAGKTTTIRMIMDIIAPDAGRIDLFGRPRASRDLDRVGYLPEERGLYRRMTVTDHLVFLGELHGLGRARARRESAAWLERVGLAAWARRRVEELSKGMQQKIQLAGTALHEPDLLILDEPFSGLDPLNQALFKDLLADHKRRGKTVIFSTHIMEQAEKLCDHICLISKGRPILLGELAALKRRLGGHAYRLAADGETDRLAEVDGIQEVLPHEGAFKLLLQDDADPAAVLRRLVGFLTVHEFRSEMPDLEEIFVKAVHDAA